MEHRMFCGTAQPQQLSAGAQDRFECVLCRSLLPAGTRVPVTWQAGTWQQHWFQTGQICDQQDKATAAGDCEHLMAS